MKKTHILLVFCIGLLIAQVILFSPSQLAINDKGQIEGFVANLRFMVYGKNFYQDQLEIIDNLIEINSYSYLSPVITQDPVRRLGEEADSITDRNFNIFMEEDRIEQLKKFRVLRSIVVDLYKRE